MGRLRVVGRDVRRVDALEKVLGTAIFTVDMKLPGMLEAKVLRSPLPHAEIASLDVGFALKVPGVQAAITSEDFANHGAWGFPVQDNHMLAHRRVRYIGDPIAAVAATNAEAAEEGLAAIELVLKPLPGVFGISQALDRKAPILHDEHVQKHDEVATRGAEERPLQSNLSETLKVRCGEPTRVLGQCDVVLDQYYSVPHQEHAYLETEAALAVPTPDGGVTVYVGDQSPFFTHGNLVMTLGLRSDLVRVIQCSVGGAFGGKSDLVYQCAAQAAKLALISGRPVRLRTTREESMIASYKREPMIMRYRLGADSDGTIRAAKIELWADSGGYASQTPLTGFRSTIHAMGPYRYSDCDVDFTGVYTNNGYSGAFRGFGNPEVTAASEQAIDEVAEKCGLDPIDFRLKNCVVQGDTLPYGQELEFSVGLTKCLERIRVLSDWDRKRSAFCRQSAAKERRRGIGIASFFHGCSLGAEGIDQAVHTIRLEADGRLGIVSGLTDYGQGSRTVFCQIAAEVLGLPLERFFVHRLDTDLADDCGPTVASRSTLVGGNATRLAALNLLLTLQAAAAMRFGCGHDEVCHVGRHFEGPDGRELSVSDAVEAAQRYGLPLSATGRWEAPKLEWSATEGRGSPYSAYHFGAQVAEVEVDLGTGATHVQHIWAVHDVGTVIFPQGARGQIIGGIAQGLGYALTERVDFREGVILNDNFHGYLVPTAADVPPITVEFIEEKLPFGPFGAKNLAEPPMVPTAPAILNAIYHATGRRIRHLPASLERVLLGHDLADSVVTACCEGEGERTRIAMAGSSHLVDGAATEAMPARKPVIVVSVRYVGNLSSQTGIAQEKVTLPIDATVRDLEMRVWELHPGLAELSGGLNESAARGFRWIAENEPAQANRPLVNGMRLQLLMLAGGG